MASKVKVKIEVDYAGIGQIAKTSDELRANLLARARRVASFARATAPDMQEGEIDVEASTRTGDRIRAYVVAQHPGVMHAEAQHRFLGTALDRAAG